MAKYFNLYISLNTGTTPVIVSTLNALQHIKPDLYSVSKVKKWPAEEPFGVECISHKRLQQSPHIPESEIKDPLHLACIQEMKK